jgi:hypothetical protein
MHCLCYIQAQVTLCLGVGFTLLMPWSSVKLANCIRYDYHVLISSHVSTRLHKNLTHIHDNWIHMCCHVHPFYNRESLTDFLVSKRTLVVEGNFHPRDLPVPCSNSFHMHCPCYMQAQVTLDLGVNFALLMSWSSVKLANCIGYISHALVSTHVSTRLQKKPTNIHDNRIHNFFHAHPFYNL